MMSATCYQTLAIYRLFGAELLAAQLETGEFYYFTRNSRDFFDFFKNPRTLSQFFFAAGIGAEDASEAAYLNEFARDLLKFRLLKESWTFVEDPNELPKIKYTRPALLRKSERKLEEVALLCRISGPNTSNTGI